jgi:hypothetical protein
MIRNLKGAWAPIVTVAMAMLLVACGAMGPSKRSASQEEASGESEPGGAAAGGAPSQERKFSEPTELDKMLDAKPIALAAVKAPGGEAASPVKPLTSTQSGKGRFRIQISAESDVDAAQAKKRDYEKLLGGSVDVVFDAPYYKLRWGFFDTKQDAEDKLLELSDVNIQGFVVKQ